MRVPIWSCSTDKSLTLTRSAGVKVTKVPLSLYYPDFTGGTDVNKAAKYILWRFTQLNRARLSIYPHLTQATDTNNVRSRLASSLSGLQELTLLCYQIRLVFAAVKETLLQNALRDSGIL